MSKFSRREFIKIMGLATAGSMFPLHRLPAQPGQINADGRNVLFLVFDAWSAFHIPFYGYERNTTPHLAQLLEHATVYHNHYASGNFTTPGTASLLTGTYPWKNGALQHNSVPHSDFQKKNIFNLFQGHHRVAYSHNLLVNTLFKFFAQELDEYIPRTDLYVGGESFYSKLFQHDEDISSLSLLRYAKRQDMGHSYSILFSAFYEKWLAQRVKDASAEFPQGLPAVNYDEYFVLTDGMRWLEKNLPTFPQPFLGYFHFLPPHAPYLTHEEYAGAFIGDGVKGAKKSEHPLSWSRDAGKEDVKRREYDEFILYIDAEIARLFHTLEENGMKDDTLIVLTSDHGELFERGVVGHRSPFLTDPVIKVPLIIYDPQHKERTDITALTSAVDILPTLLHLNGQEAPDWLDGAVLPPYGPALDERTIYAIVASLAGTDTLDSFTVSAIQKNLKYTHYAGYEELDGNPLHELFDLAQDPFELKNLYGENEMDIQALYERLRTQVLRYYPGTNF